MRGKLNLFQRTMLRWRELHPYSAVHAVRLAEPLDATRLEGDIARALEALGLTGLEVDWARGRYVYRGGPAEVRLKVLPGGNADAVLESEFEDQLNMRFLQVGGALQPFRFFAIDCGKSFYLGVAYDHFIAGGDSIVVLLKRLVQRHQGFAMVNPAPPLELYPGTFSQLYLRYPGQALGGLPNLPRFFAGCKRSFRSPLARATSPDNGFLSFRIEAETLAGLLRAAEAWNVTLNDVCLGAALLALSPAAEGRRQATRRRELAVAAIWNIRREFQPEAGQVFGQFLSAFRVSHAVPPGIGLRELAGDVHRETTRIKDGKLYLQTLLTLELSGLMWRFLSPEQRRTFFAKNYPVWAGVTTLNVNGLWHPAESRDHPLEYVRVAPTGPLSPLIFALTTFGKAAHLGVSFRSGVFSRARVEAIVDDFLGRIGSLGA